MTPTGMTGTIKTVPTGATGATGALTQGPSLPTGATGTPNQYTGAPQVSNLATEPAITTKDIPMNIAVLQYALAAFAYSVAFKTTAKYINSTPNANGLFVLDANTSKPSQISAEDITDSEKADKMNKEALDGVMTFAGFTEEQKESIHEDSDEDPSTTT